LKILASDFPLALFHPLAQFRLKADFLPFMNTVKAVLLILLLLASLSFALRLNGWSLFRIALWLCLVLVLGAIWGGFALVASSPHPPPWSQHAMPFLGAISGLIFVSLLFVFRFWKK
jgi:hypothetical protein